MTQPSGVEGLLLLEGFLNSNLNAVIVFPLSENYDMLSPQFEKSGHAFLLHEQKTVVIDGDVVQEEWFTPEHLDVILAHELAHYRADHAKSGYVVCDVEKEADWLGCMILRHHGRPDSASLHDETYQERYGTTVDCDREQMHDFLKEYIF